MKAKEFRSKKYGDQRHLFSDQDQEFIDQMMEEYASQPTASEEEIIHIMRIGLEYITDADGMGRFFGERETAKAIIQSLNVQGDAQQRYEKALQYVERAVHIDGELDQDKALRIAAGLKDKP